MSNRNLVGRILTAYFMNAQPNENFILYSSSNFMDGGLFLGLRVGEILSEIEFGIYWNSLKLRGKKKCRCFRLEISYDYPTVRYAQAVSFHTAKNYCGSTLCPIGNHACSFVSVFKPPFLDSWKVIFRNSGSHILVSVVRFALSQWTNNTLATIRK